MSTRGTERIADAVEIAKAVTDSLSTHSLVDAALTLSDAVLNLNGALAEAEAKAAEAEARTASIERELTELRHAHEATPRGGPETPGSLA